MNGSAAPSSAHPSRAAPTVGETTSASRVVGTDVPEAVVWRYPDMCRHWGVSRPTIERWVRRYEATGEGIPVHRDPSGRPYWLAHEAAADAQQGRGAGDAPPGPDRHVALADDERVERLRRAAQRGQRVV